MMTLLEWILVLAAAFGAVTKIIEVAWKVKIATKKAARAVSDNAVVAFFAKIATFAYFTLVIPAIDRALN